MKHTLSLILCTCLLFCALCPHAFATDEQTTATQTADTQQTQPEQTETTLPQSADFLFINAAMGYGSGTLNLVMPQVSNANEYALYWGDANGMRLEEYTPFMTGEIASMTVFGSTSEGFSIPADAKTVVLYTYSKQFGESTVPFKVRTSVDGASGLLNFTLPRTGELITELVIVSDLHIGSGQSAEQNLVAMLKDVAKTAPNAAGILVAGDAVETADEANYQKLQQLCASVAGAPPVYLGVGNRGYLSADYKYDANAYAKNLQTFLKYAGHPFGVKLETPYYSYKLGGTLIVFIGADSYHNGNAVYSQEQLTWLDSVLGSTDKYEPVFVIMHEPLPGTVSGSLTGQGYGNVDNPTDVKNILKKYGNITVFSGHTQWSLEEPNTMTYISTGSSMYNTAGVAHLWYGENGVGYEVAGSQGYYVTVYEDAILIRGRDFTTGKWISNALYMTSTSPVPVQQQTSASTAKPSSSTTKPVEEETTEEAESSIVEELKTPLCILAVMTVIVFIIVFYKPKEKD